jgi:hypothetical protein
MYVLMSSGDDTDDIVSEGALDQFAALHMSGSAPSDEDPSTHKLPLSELDVKTFTQTCGGKFPFPCPVRTEEEVKLIMQLATSDAQAANRPVDHSLVCKVCSG